MDNNKTELFNQVQLGYVVVESKKLADWRTFAEQGLGMHVAVDSDKEVSFRIDDQAKRLIIQHGPAEDVVAVGMAMANRQVLDAVLKRLEKLDVTVQQGNDADAQSRGVKALWYFKGPKGLQVEVYCGAVRDDAPLDMLTSGFVTGNGGMGHVAITTRNPDRMMAFWQSLFDARLSDSIRETIAGITLDITFLRFNERHHSIAVAATQEPNLDPIRTRVQHISFLSNSLDDVGSAFRRLKSLGYEMAHEVGQHPNDKEISFYALSPSGFEIELGCDALTVNEESWQVNHYQGISLWGHKPQKTGLISFLSLNGANLIQGLRSLRHKEFFPF
ncbi:VOC family protein [Alcanivorax sp.]|jgi:2,3-dihydroxybiphenyl 1,2-dioxygenase|uniref:VOC family protein n=1 Tax=Alcanivorax sp. TaxID=1872427 RepID=UPI0032D97A8B